MIQHTLNTPYPVGPVHFYTFDTDDGFIMFDTGPLTMEAVTYLKNRLDLSKLRKVFVTHCHADHCGMLDFLEKNTDADIYLSRYDAILYEELDKRLEVLSGILLGAGFPVLMMDAMEQTIIHLRAVNPKPDSYRILEESEDVLEKLDLSYLRCPGHSQSDIVFLHQGYAISGDVLLRNVFTTPLLDMNFDTFDGRFSNYEAYCDTILKLKSIEDMNFLPGHKETVDSVDERIKYYVGKLFERSLKLKDPLSKNSVYDVVRTLIPETMENPLSTYLKASEVIFMQDLIEKPDRLFQSLSKIGLAGHFRKQFDQIIL